MTEVIRSIIRNSSWFGAQILVSVPEKGYVDMKLRNGLFCTVQLRNAYEAEVRLAQFGGFSSLIGSDNVCELLEKLSH